MSRWMCHNCGFKNDPKKAKGRVCESCGFDHAIYDSYVLGEDGKVIWYLPYIPLYIFGVKEQ